MSDRQEIEALKELVAIKDAEIEKLKKDAERIDWLAKNSKTCTPSVPGDEKFFPNYRAAHLYGGTYRQAIDNAIAIEKEKENGKSS